MFKDYLLEVFFPWSLKIDYKNSVSLISKEKEKFICDMYNHFAYDFKSLATYELHMFRISTSKIAILNKDVITITLPEDKKFYAVCIVYNDEGCAYYTINKTNQNHYDLISYIGDKKITSKLDSDLSNLNNSIINSLL